MKTKAKETVKKAVAKKTVSPVAKREKTKRVAFSVRAKEGSKVFLAGSFNDWNPTAKEMVDKAGDGTFAASVNLPAGTHEYKFVIDGIWCADPGCADWKQNDKGTLNSVKHVE
ncbi:MAG: glycogen-binding domain-containing protein [Kiritimatiellaeota bacterium]|nr:glycogen-binding domain-containing protein [Kiritimatiellota bacterium]